MSRTLLSILVVGLASLPALAIPARPLYDPPALPHAPPSFTDLRGSRWYGKTYEKADMTIIFEPNGKLTWSYSGNTYTTGSWKQEGNAIYIEMNNRYCEFKGHINGSVIEGGWWNVTGLRWPNPLYSQPMFK